MVYEGWGMVYCEHEWGMENKSLWLVENNIITLVYLCFAISFLYFLLIISIQCEQVVNAVTYIVYWEWRGLLVWCIGRFPLSITIFELNLIAVIGVSHCRLSAVLSCCTRHSCLLVLNFSKCILYCYKFCFYPSV
jgi:hypothetical protein